MILSSLIEPTTLTSTFAFLASYSATTFLNALSSRALHPTQTVSVVAEVRLVEADDETTPTVAASTITRSANPTVALRLIWTNLLLGAGRPASRGESTSHPRTLGTFTRRESRIEKSECQPDLQTIPWRDALRFRPRWQQRPPIRVRRFPASSGRSTSAPCSRRSAPGRRSPGPRSPGGRGS